MAKDSKKVFIPKKQSLREAQELSGNPVSLVMTLPESHPEISYLVELGSELKRLSQEIGADLPQTVRSAFSQMIKGANCFYSNMIENISTYPADIDNALRGNIVEFTNPQRQQVQKEAVAHIEVQTLMDSGLFDNIDNDTDLVKAIHFELYSRFPEEASWSHDSEDGQGEKITPGEFRKHGVMVGLHGAISPEMIPGFMNHFSYSYAKSRVPESLRPAVAMASHHRLLWIHPFPDGNGRTGRFHTHAMLRRYGIDTSMWSISRAFARTRADYYKALDRADWARQGAMDGRGSLSDGGLAGFCTYALETAVGEAGFMSWLLNPKDLIKRTTDFVIEEANLGKLDIRVIPLLEQLYLIGYLPKNEINNILGVPVKNIESIISLLQKRGLIVNDTNTESWLPAFPLLESEMLFPYLMPEDMPDNLKIDDSFDSKNEDVIGAK